MGDLQSFIKNNRKFIKINPGESFEGVYRGNVIAPDPFNKDLEIKKEIVIYKLQEDPDGPVLGWNCKQIKVAQDFDKIEIGKKVKITRTGAGTSDTKYTITVIQ